MATKVILGGVEFTPPPRRKIDFNNPRVIAKIDIPGAPPAYQDMGEDETNMAWDGVLYGDDAYRKAIQFESMKDQGKPVQLLVSDFPEMSKTVRIRSFPWSIVRDNYIEYSIDLVAEMPPPVVSQIITPAPAPGVEGQSAQPAAPSGNTYVIKAGDTLWDLAVNQYGDGTRWREIADANGIMDPTTLQIGQEITIPT